jgi:putative PIN family toxin of toxin-antitoxin system
MKVVIDTNVLVSALSSKSVFHPLIIALLDEQFELCVTDGLFMEYEEILNIKYSETVASNFLTALKVLPNVCFTHVYFHWNLITNDPDDNKFVDCYIAAGAQYLVSNDTHFSILNSVAFPKVIVLKIEEFINIINTG